MAQFTDAELDEVIREQDQLLSRSITFKVQAKMAAEQAIGTYHQMHQESLSVVMQELAIVQPKFPLHFLAAVFGEHAELKETPVAGFDHHEQVTDCS